MKNENVMSYWITRVFLVRHCSSQCILHEVKPYINGNHVNTRWIVNEKERERAREREKKQFTIKHTEQIKMVMAKHRNGYRQAYKNWNIVLFNKYLALFMALYVFILNRISTLPTDHQTIQFAKWMKAKKQQQQQQQHRQRTEKSIRNQCCSVSTFVVLLYLAGVGDGDEDPSSWHFTSSVPIPIPNLLSYERLKSRQVVCLSS